MWKAGLTIEHSHNTHKPSHLVSFIKIVKYVTTKDMRESKNDRLITTMPPAVMHA